METISYFLRYLAPIFLPFAVVIALVAFNCFVYKFLPIKHSVGGKEVYSYSLLGVGPIAYVLFFIFFFYGGLILTEEWGFVGIIFLGDLVLIVIGFLLNLVFLSKLH